MGASISQGETLPANSGAKPGQAAKHEKPEVLPDDSKQEEELLLPGKEQIPVPGTEQPVVPKRPARVDLSQVEVECDLSALGWFDSPAVVVLTPDKKEDIASRLAIAEQVNAPFPDDFQLDPNSDPRYQINLFLGERLKNVLEKSAEEAVEPEDKAQYAKAAALAEEMMVIGAQPLQQEKFYELERCLAHEHGLLIELAHNSDPQSSLASRYVSAVEGRFEVSIDGKPIRGYLISDPGKHYMGSTSSGVFIPKLNRDQVVGQYSQDKSGLASVRALMANELAQCWLKETFDVELSPGAEVPWEPEMLPAGPELFDDAANNLVQKITVNRLMHGVETHSDKGSTVVEPEDVERLLTFIVSAYVQGFDKLDAPLDPADGYDLSARLGQIALEAYDRKYQGNEAKHLDFDKTIEDLSSTKEGQRMAELGPFLRAAAYYERYLVVRDENSAVEFNSVVGPKRREEMQRAEDKAYQGFVQAAARAGVGQDDIEQRFQPGAVEQARREHSTLFAQEFPKIRAAVVRLSEKLGPEGKREIATVYNHYGTYIESKFASLEANQPVEGGISGAKK